MKRIKEKTVGSKRLKLVNINSLKVTNVDNNSKQSIYKQLSVDLFGDKEEFLKKLNVESELLQDTGCSQIPNNDNRPVWCDEDDDANIKTALTVQGRDLINGGCNDKVETYSNHLKHKFTSLYQTQAWSDLFRIPNKDSDDEILSAAGHLLKLKPCALPPSKLQFKKVSDLNKETYNEGPLITSVEFHPSSSVALVAGISGIANLFAVDGKSNNLIHSILLKNFPIECAKFINDLEILIGSKYSHMFSYDLATCKSFQVQLPYGITKCKKIEISPCGKILALAGKHGEIHLLSANSKELIKTLKQNNNVSDFAFHSSGLFFGQSNENEVTVWNISNYKVTHKWIDEGCMHGTKLAISPCKKLLATSSAQGVVNLYDIENTLTNSNPKPIKSILNLTTAITSLQFNPTAEILSLASSDFENSVRLFHIASGKMFENFPQWKNKLGHINKISFSPQSGYCAFANRKSTVYLYRLKHYTNY